MSWATPTLLFRTAAAIYAIAVPGHVVMGFDKVYPALNSAPKIGKHAIGLRGAQNCWNLVAVSFIICTLQNLQWSRTGGPQTREEVGMFWSTFGILIVNGFRYCQVGAYETTVALWLAPMLSLVAWYKS